MVLYIHVYIPRELYYNMLLGIRSRAAENTLLMKVKELQTVITSTCTVHVHSVLKMAWPGQE